MKQYRRIHKLNTTHGKRRTRNTAKQNYPGSAACYDTRPGNEKGLFLSAPREHTTRGDMVETMTEFHLEINKHHSQRIPELTERLPLDITRKLSCG